MSDPFETGYSHLFTVRGIPVEAHWSVVLLMVLAGGGLHLAPGAWLGAFVLVLVHELGHAVVARHLRMRVLRIRMHGLGGECVYSGAATREQDAKIAWGGVLGQLALLVLTFIAVRIWGLPIHTFGADLFDVLTEVNIVVACINLVPIAPLDGYRAWRLLPVVYARAEHVVRRERRRVERELRRQKDRR